MIIDSNLNDVLIDIEKDVKETLDSKKSNNMLNDITVGLLRTMRRRIHNEGLTAKLISIGSYSTEPAYFNPRRGAISVSAQNKGKTGKSEFNNGKPHKTRYYSDGYKGWRKANRRKTGKVDLFFKGDLSRGFTFQKFTNELFGLGFNNTINLKKAIGLESHFNADIWGIGVRENKVIDETIEMYLNKL